MPRTTPAGTPLGDDFHLYDTTLRDGAQREGISYSVAEKLAVARLVDRLGVGFIEGGWPGAMPKDTEFFARAAAGELELEHAALVAFGSTRRPGGRAQDDPQLRALLDSAAPVITLVAKSDRRHVQAALRTDPAENLAMVADSVRLLVAEGRRVFLDAEHFFDGYAYDADHALRVLEAAMTAGADVAVLCDTNGGQLPLGLADTVREVVARTGFRVGIHCQDDSGCAVANSVAAVQAGATHVQCTANGYGERTGNADLMVVTANLASKLDMPVLPPGNLTRLTEISHQLAALAGLPRETHQPYVGASAFAHKAGLHASALRIDPSLYNHIEPESVGNGMRVLVTEMAGRASVELKGKELGLDLAGAADAVGRTTVRVKELEAQGWSFEAADASFELLLRSELDGKPSRPPFTLQSYQVVTEHGPGDSVVARASVAVTLGEDTEPVRATATGNGPVNALDAAVRSALAGRVDWLDRVRLLDYSVRILGPVGVPAQAGQHLGDPEGAAAAGAAGSGVAGHGTGAVTRVLAITGDGDAQWSTVGVHANVIEASWLALADAWAHAALRYATPAG